MNTLQISFDGLAETYQKIFLDIACFFKWENRNFVTKILDVKSIEINVLIEKCLIAILYNKLWVHDLLQEMAIKIVQKASPNDIGKRSRLWDKDDVRHVLTNDEGTEAIEGIISSFSEQEDVPLRANAFSDMKKLRMLQIQNVKLPQRLDYLSNELRFLKWHRYPLKFLPSSFHPDKIVVLEMCYSRIQQLWQGIKEPLNKLKFINLSHLENLTMMPDFTWIPNLENLTLEGCTRLLKLHPSIGDLKRLIVLNLKDCKSLSSLPMSIKWESLEVCILAGCSKLAKFLGCKGARQKSWHLSSLFQRPLDPMALMLSSLLSLSCLKELDLSDCNLGEGAIPNDFGGLSSLEKLDLSNNNFVSLPTSINQLSNLYTLYLNDCKRLKSLPTSINQLSKLYTLCLNDCKRLKSLPVLPRNIVHIAVLNCTSLEILPDVLQSLSVSNLSRFLFSFFGFNCLKLVDNEEVSNLVFAMIKRGLLQECYYDFCVPYIVVPGSEIPKWFDGGSEIPKWFSHQSEGASTRIERIAFFYKEMFAAVVCCVFVIHEFPPMDDDYDDELMIFELHSPHQLMASGVLTSFVQEKTADTDDSLSRPHLWLNVVFSAFRFEFIYKHRLILYFAHKCPSIEVKKFGIRLIHEDEVKELKQAINQCSSSTFQNFNQDLDKSTSNDARIEKLFDECTEYGYREREFSISITNLGAVWEDL